MERVILQTASHFIIKFNTKFLNSIKSTKDILAPEERNILFKIQHDIVDRFRDSRTMSIVYEGLEFKSKANDRREATNDIILQVFKHMQATKNLLSCAAEPSDGSKERQMRETLDRNCFFGQPLVTSSTPKPSDVLTQYNFFERCTLLLNRINTFDNIAVE